MKAISMSAINSKPFSQGLVLYLQQHPDCSFDDVANWALGWSAASEHYKDQEFHFVNASDAPQVKETEIVTAFKAELDYLRGANKDLKTRLAEQKKVFLDYVDVVVRYLRYNIKLNDKEGAAIVTLGNKIIDSNK